MNDLDIEGLIGSVLRGALGGGRKRNRGALRYLTGGRSSFLNASTLLTVAGVAWGLWESAQASTAAKASVQGVQGGTVPPPLPTAVPTGAAAAPLTMPPPLPTSGAASASPVTVPPEVLRVLRLTLAAARADGTLAPNERDAILTRASELGAEPLIAAELDTSRPLGEIVSGVADPQTRQDLYTLAFAVVRGDETVTAEERTWLKDLAGQLGLDASTVDNLEQHAASRIAAAAEGAQH